VPDNAVKSTAVWRLTFDPNTETIIAPPEAMVPLADVRTLKPNGMVMGPDGNLYISDLVEPNIRRLTNPNGDPRLQVIEIIGQTGDLRGANGSMGVIGSKIFIAENRAASFMDVYMCGPVSRINPFTGLPQENCSTLPVAQASPFMWNDGSAGFIPMPSGVFVGGVATDATRNYVYVADSPGGANATIWRYNWSLFPAGQPQVYLSGGTLPFSGTPEATVWTSTTSVRPWNPLYPQVPGGTPALAGFSFAFGIYVDQRNGDLYITGDPTAGARSGWGSAWIAPVVQ
jgi:hypothetical protein